MVPGSQTGHLTRGTALLPDIPGSPGQSYPAPGRLLRAAGLCRSLTPCSAESRRPGRSRVAEPLSALGTPQASVSPSDARWFAPPLGLPSPRDLSIPHLSAWHPSITGPGRGQRPLSPWDRTPHSHPHPGQLGAAVSQSPTVRQGGPSRRPPCPAAPVPVLPVSARAREVPLVWGT